MSCRMLVSSVIEIKITLYLYVQGVLYLPINLKVGRCVKKTPHLRIFSGVFIMGTYLPIYEIIYD